MSHGPVKSARNGNGAQAPDSPRDGTDSPAPPPDGGYGWMVAFASFMIHILTDGLTYTFGVFYTELLEYFNEGKAKTAWIVSILVGVTLISGPVSSSFVNRWGCRAVTVAGALLAFVCVLASAFANNVLTLILTIGVGTGFGFGLIYLPAIVSVTVWFERYRSLATGIAVCGSGLGTFIFAPIVDALINEYGWRGTMAIMSAIILNCVPLGLMFRPVPEVPRTPALEPMLPKSKQSTPLKRSQSTEQVVKANGKTDDSDVAKLTLSQPALNQEHSTSQDHRLHRHSRHGSGIMQRPDVLYQGSMTSLAKFRAPSPEKTPHETIAHEQKCGWLPCSEDVKDALSEMLDFSLLTNPIFILFSVSNFLTSIGFYIPYVYTVEMAKKLQISNPEYLISVMGASNLIGRIILGFISDKPWVNRLLAYNLCLTLAGISVGAALLCSEFWGLAMYATVFGFTIGAYVGLTSVVLVDLLGLEKLTNAFGLLLLFQGIASIVGAPLGGFLFDYMQSFAPAYIMSAITISMSGLILFLIPFFERRMNERQWNQDIGMEDI